MHLRHPDGQIVHLACGLTRRSGAETVSGTDLPGLLRQLDMAGRQLRRQLDVDLLSLSLHVPPAFAAALASSAGLRRRLRDGLAERGLEVVTLHGGERGQQNWRVWLTYLLDLARTLADLLPDEASHGSISVLVPSFGDEPWEAAAREMDDLSAGLTEIAWHTGRLVLVALEPAAGTLLTRAEDGARLLRRADPMRIGICLSTQHLISHGEAPLQSLARLRRARLSVTKVRLGAGSTPAALSVTQATLSALLGGVHPLCLHLEADNAEELDAVRRELGILGLDGSGARPMTGF